MPASSATSPSTNTGRPSATHRSPYTSSGPSSWHDKPCGPTSAYAGMRCPAGTSTRSLSFTSPRCGGDGLRAALSKGLGHRRFVLSLLSEQIWVVGLSSTKTSGVTVTMVGLSHCTTQSTTMMLLSGTSGCSNLAWPQKWPAWSSPRVCIRRHGEPSLWQP